jgi:hypothetical protein
MPVQLVETRRRAGGDAGQGAPQAGGGMIMHTASGHVIESRSAEIPSAFCALYLP